jgi:hypothetical protein
MLQITLGKSMARYLPLTTGFLCASKSRVAQVGIGLRLRRCGLSCIAVPRTLRYSSGSDVLVLEKSYAVDRCVSGRRVYCMRLVSQSAPPDNAHRGSLISLSCRLFQVKAALFGITGPGYQSF